MQGGRFGGSFASIFAGPQSTLGNGKRVGGKRAMRCCGEVQYYNILDGQNRQSPIASDFGSRTQIAALFAVLLYPNV